MTASIVMPLQFNVIWPYSKLNVLTYFISFLCAENSEFAQLYLKGPGISTGNYS